MQKSEAYDLAVAALSQEDWVIADGRAWHEPGDTQVSWLDIQPVADAIWQAANLNTLRVDSVNKPEELTMVTWSRNGKQVHDGFRTFNCSAFDCATEADAERAVQMLERAFIEGKQSVFEKLADLTDTPLPDMMPQA